MKIIWIIFYQDLVICFTHGDGEHGKKLVDDFMKKGVIADFREPNILRSAPVPMYNSYEDVYRFVEIMEGH